MKGNPTTKLSIIAGFILLFAGVAQAVDQRGFRIEVLIDGKPVPEYWSGGTTYVEALKGKEYAIRIINPLPTRVAVALAVDGLNTIDARHTDARSARKWVLGPYETVTIEGWQTNSQQARKFFFTTEEKSYGAWLGKTENLGVISAVFFKEKEKERWIEERSGGRMKAESQNMPAAPAPSASEGAKGRADKDSASKLSAQADEYAATGIGDRVEHNVYQVYLDLEQAPSATVSVRYEYRPVLAQLGIFPPTPKVDPLTRRQQARGFEKMSFCPEPR